MLSTVQYTAAVCVCDLDAPRVFNDPLRLLVIWLHTNVCKLATHAHTYTSQDHVSFDVTLQRDLQGVELSLGSNIHAHRFFAAKIAG